MKMIGYRGKVLEIDLTERSIEVKSLDDDHVRQFLGGAGLACRLIFDRLSPETDPLGPENPLVFMTGPFCGTMVPTGSKASFCARSPLTGIWGHSTVGGHLGADLRFAGYDGLVVIGKASSPVYILINDDRIEIMDAAHLWGKDTEETWELLKKETGLRLPGIARIGVAGENLVKYASIIVDHFRAAGRTGMGAVMGSKNLKALVVSGSDRDIPVAEKENLSEFCRSLNEDKKEHPAFMMYSELGTAGFVDMASLMYGSLPAGYFSVPDFDSYKISGTSVKETILVGKSACFRCPIGCGRVIEINEGRYRTGKFAGPELEVTGTMGSQILNDDIEALSFANRKLDLLGIDTISGGNTIAFAYYLFSEGLIDEESLDGIRPEWGNIDAALELMDRIAQREGIGDIMAEGSRALGERFGHADLAAQVNGMELPMHDPRGFSGMAIGYATSPRGACHMTADMYNTQMGIVDEGFNIKSEDRFANEADIAARLQDFRSITNSAVICNFYPIESNELMKILNLVTGWDISLEELKLIGERIFTIMRLLNLKLGYNTKNEKLPSIVLRPLEGPTEGHVPDIDEQLDTWYEFRGWDRQTGKPSIEKLRKLDLEGLE